MDRQQVVEEARSWIGVPYRHQGRTRAHGVDCLGLIVVVSHALGLSDYDTNNYRRDTIHATFLSTFRQEMQPVPIPERSEGDVLIFRQKRFPCHCGILTMKNGVEHFIHAYGRRKGVFEEALPGEWQRRLTHCFRFRGLGG